MGQAIYAEIVSGPELNDDGSITSVVRAGNQTFRFTHHGQFITYPESTQTGAHGEALAAAHRRLHEFLADNPDALRRVVDLSKSGGKHAPMP